MVNTAATILLLIPALPWSLAATTVSVGSCQDLQDAAAATASGNVVAELDSTIVNCGSWTNVEITKNRLKIVAGSEYDDSATFSLYNVRFVVSSGTLLVDVGLSLGASSTETDGREVNGGILYVADGAVARFSSDVYMTRSLLAATDGGSDASWVGGCIYNEGLLRFLSALETDGCSTEGGSGSIAGDGGAIWNGENGKVVVKGSMILRGLWEIGIFSVEGSRGGTIFNRGEFVVHSDAELTNSKAADGGSIYNEGVFTFRSGSYPLFDENYSGGADIGGGHVVNSGTMRFKGGVRFHFGVALQADGGGVVNSGTLIIANRAEFIETSADRYGGAIATSTSATLKIPDDIFFEDVYVAGRNDVYDCDLIYIADDSGGYTCGP